MKNTIQAVKLWIRARSGIVKATLTTVLIGALLILLITNPSPSSFESFIKSKIDTNQLNYVAYGRSKNYFIYSIYEINSTYRSEEYLKKEFGLKSLRFKGQLGNFHPID